MVYIIVKGNVLQLSASRGVTRAAAPAGAAYSILRPIKPPGKPTPGLTLELALYMLLPISCAHQNPAVAG